MENMTLNEKAQAAGIPVFRVTAVTEGREGSPPILHTVDPGNTLGGPATIPPVLDDSHAMDNSGFDRSGSDMSMMKEEVNRLLEEEKGQGGQGPCLPYLQARGQACHNRDYQS